MFITKRKHRRFLKEKLESSWEQLVECRDLLGESNVLIKELRESLEDYQLRELKAFAAENHAIDPMTGMPALPQGWAWDYQPGSFGGNELLLLSPRGEHFHPRGVECSLEVPGGASRLQLVDHAQRILGNIRNAETPAELGTYPPSSQMKTNVGVSND